MLNTWKDRTLDFSQRFAVGGGTFTEATADTLDEVARFHSTMDSLSAHFCWIYDRQEHRRMPGYDFWWAQREGSVEDSPRWIPW